jgi:hypothetical protein
MKELKEALSFGIALGNGLGKSLEDGKIDFTDVINLWKAINTANAAIDGAFKIPAELAQLDDAKLLILRDFVKAEFDIPQDSVEAVIEAAIGLSLHAYKFVSIFKKDAA